MQADDGLVIDFRFRVTPRDADKRPVASGQHDPLWRELVGQVLRSERVLQRRTLQQVAERAGVSPQYLSEVERGRKDASSEMLESICGSLGLRLADLLTASGQLLVTAVRLSQPLSGPSGVTMLAA
jgi:DNA-binding XRE family transcriptional regulator